MRLASIFTPLLLGFSATSVLAGPVENVNDLQERTLVLDTRGLNLKVKEEPKKDATCPYRQRVGNFGPYDRHKYTKNQIKAAFLGGAKLAADGKQVGANRYPHDFNNGEKLPFKCGRNKMEFPISTDNKVYNGGPADNIPDRVVFEYQKKKKDFIVKYCGVMRHGPGRDFLKCD
ncbi:hypothetical protein C2857_005086 [Epichloe festucae Fl1]|uniref:Uncharacterized protein n=1 Tax=Epichloe festucae (strain Fl1) TaxID=877507 RepID=A0A7S9KV55_EPIFF|nr:hypothetical protein C2857_005086 [Epichloe festucae Fl1]